MNKTANKAEDKKVADLVGTDHPRKIGNRQEADVNDTLEAVRNLYEYETEAGYTKAGMLVCSQT